VIGAVAGCVAAVARAVRLLVAGQTVSAAQYVADVPGVADHAVIAVI